MGNKYLNKNVKFQCQSGNSVWFSAKKGDEKVRIQMGETLLDDCELKLIGGPRNGQCNLFIDPSTGTPAPCVAINVNGKWNNNSNVKVSGKSVLTSNCSILCTRCGEIKPFRPTVMNINVDDDAKTQSTNGEPIIKNHNDFVNNDNDKQANEEAKNIETSDDIAKENLIIEDALCDYKNCSKRESCKYLKTPNTLIETDESKNAAELKVNMGKDTFDLYAGDCSNIATFLYGGHMYSIAHHHIIPANQCFKQFPEIVKLANYYGYNINKAENGISLPTMNQGYDKQQFEVRREIAFNAMKCLGKQWHKGGHKYSCKISAEMDKVLPKPFKHYKDSVDEELSILRNKLYDETKCRENEYEKNAEEFIKLMDHICERVANKLRKFEVNSRKSYPFYISKLAFYYAYFEELKEYEDDLFQKEG